MDDVLELARSNVELGANVIYARICRLCGFSFSSDAEHPLYGVNEENRDEYKADFEGIGDLSNDIGLKLISA